MYFLRNGILVKDAMQFKISVVLNQLKFAYTPPEVTVKIFHLSVGRSNEILAQAFFFFLYVVFRIIKWAERRENTFLFLSDSGCQQVWRRCPWALSCFPNTDTTTGSDQIALKLFGGTEGRWLQDWDVVRRRKFDTQWQVFHVTLDQIQLYFE